MESGTFKYIRHFKKNGFGLVQSKCALRLKLQSAKYTEENGSLVKRFLMYVMSMARNLMPPLSEPLLTGTISRHCLPQSMYDNNIVRFHEAQNSMHEMEKVLKYYNNKQSYR